MEKNYSHFYNLPVKPAFFLQAGSVSPGFPSPAPHKHERGNLPRNAASFAG